MVATLHMQLDFPMSKSPLGPSNSMICPKSAPKWPPKAPEVVQIGRCELQTKIWLYLGAHGSKRDVEGT